MKKIFDTLKLIYFPFLLAFFAVSCSDDEIEIKQYIHLDSNSFTFDYKGKNTCTLTISSSPEWEVQLDADWVTVSDRTENSLTLAATPNETEGIRRGTITLKAGNAEETIYVSQLYKFELSKFKIFDEFSRVSSAVVMSHSGRYIAGLDFYSVYNWQTYEQYYSYTPIIIDLETGEVKVYKPIENRALSLKAVSDDGETLLIGETFKWFGCFRKDEFIDLPVPEEMDASDCFVDTFSADGSIIYGYGRKKGGKRYYPVCWTNGVDKIMALQEVDGHGAAMGNDISGGNRILGCSADGSVAYGVDQNSNKCVLWDQSGIHFVGEEEYHTVEGQIDLSDWGYGIVDAILYNQCEVSFVAEGRMSSNGKYIAMRYYKGDIVDMWYDDSYHPVRFNTETGKVEIFEDIVNMSGLTVDDEGIMYLMTETPRNSTPQSEQTGMVYDPAAGTLVTCKEWVRQKYGIIVPDIQIVKVASNGNILANTYVSDDGSLRPVQCLIIP